MVGAIDEVFLLLDAYISHIDAQVSNYNNTLWPSNVIKSVDLELIETIIIISVGGNDTDNYSCCPQVTVNRLRHRKGSKSFLTPFSKACHFYNYASVRNVRGLGIYTLLEVTC